VLRSEHLPPAVGYRLLHRQQRVGMGQADRPAAEYPSSLEGVLEASPVRRDSVSEVERAFVDASREHDAGLQAVSQMF
jgi:hypothetical protein